VISSYFADIFRNNALNNSILPIIVSEDDLSMLFSKVKDYPETKLQIDLPSQTVSLEDKSWSCTFEINPYKKECLLKGYDDIDFALSNRYLIEEWEKKS
ncbi:MAG: 3-isopropylmalate dehydratase small subunit, partial [Bacteroidales bacterium]